MKTLPLMVLLPLLALFGVAGFLANEVFEMWGVYNNGTSDMNLATFLILLVGIALLFLGVLIWRACGEAEPCPYCGRYNLRAYDGEYEAIWFRCKNKMCGKVYVPTNETEAS